MKTMQKMLAMSLICGGALLTSCSDDSSDSSPQAPQASKEQTAFVEKTRENLKEIAENLNFNSWKLANELNQQFNERVLNNPETEKVVSEALIGDVMSSLKPVAEDSELGKMGKEYAVTVDLSEFKYRFTMDTKGEFKKEEADNFELVIPAYNPETKKVEAEKFKLTLKMSGDKVKIPNDLKVLDALAVVVAAPTDVSFAISTKDNGKWKDFFTGKFKNEFKLKDKSEYFDKMTTAFTVSGEVKASVPAFEKNGTELAADDVTIKFTVGQDPSKHKSTLEFSFVHNDKKIVAISAENKRDGSDPVDLSSLPNSNSIIDLFAALIEGQSLEGMTITLMDDIEVSVKISDRDELLEAQRAMNEARRSYADESTVDGYTQKMNKLVTASLTAKDLDAKIPMKFETVKFGVDYISMPALIFNKEEGYVPLTELLDQEFVIYGLNIVDHAVDPMAETIVVIRQLMQYFQTLEGTYGDLFNVGGNDK